MYWKKLLALLLLSIASKGFAVEPFVIKDIAIRGLKRFSEGTVYTYLPIKVGEQFTDATSTNIIRSLYATGFFKKINLSERNQVLIIDLVEQPVISEIKITGNKTIKTKELTEGLAAIGLAPSRTFSQALLEQVKAELEHTYQSMGQYDTKISIEHRFLDQDRVAIQIHIIEGTIAKIKQINFIGNKAYSDKILNKNFKLAKTNLLSWFSKTDQYAKEKLATDLESLRSFYLDRGYIQFKIEASDVSITPNKQHVYITVSMAEGEQYVIADIELAGEFPVPKEELQAFITLQKGDIFSRSKIIAITQEIATRLGEEGYANATVTPIPTIDELNKVVHLKLLVEPNERIYVRRIHLKGNTKTHDEVARREITQMESAYINTKKVKESQTKLNRIGYFKEVQVATERVAEYSNMLDLTYTLEEAPSGSIQGGIGFSDVEGFLINASISNRNFMGTGNTLDVEFNNSKSYTTYNIGYTNPYITIDGISRGFNLFYHETDLAEISNVSSYTTNAYGANLTHGIPISQYDKVTFGVGIEKTQLSLNRATAPLEILQFLQANGSDYLENPLSFGWQHNSLDRYIFPEEGFNQSINLTVTTPVSDLLYYRASYKAKWFYPLGRGYIINLVTHLGYGDGYGKTEGLPFYQHFFAGGSRGVRGFNENSLGPKDSNARPYGGNLLVTGSAQFVLPNYFAPENKTVRAALFLDAGQVYDVRNKNKLDEGMVVSRSPDGLRYSVGASVTWVSPVAPLVFSLAVPLNKHSEDKTQAFAFSFGTFFN